MNKQEILSEIQELLADIGIYSSWAKSQISIMKKIPDVLMGNAYSRILSTDILEKAEKVKELHMQYNELESK